MAPRVPIKVEFSEESLMALRDIGERLERISTEFSKICEQQHGTGEAIARSLNKGTLPANWGRR